MDNFKKPPARSGQQNKQRALDGFLNLPVPISRPVIGQPVRPRARQSVRTHDFQRKTGDLHRSAPLVTAVVPSESILHKARPLPQYVAPMRPLRPVKKPRFRAWSLRIASLVVVGFLATGGFLFWKGYANLHKVFNGTGTVAALTKNVDPSLLKGEGDGRVNVLLLGIGGAGHSGPDLTDTMLILSIDPVNNTANLLSVPRDLWVKMPTNFFGKYQKINAAYESAKYSYVGRQDSTNKNKAAIQAGFAADDQILGQVLGIKINYHVLVDFRAFKQAIDTVGGVTIDVKERLFDPTMAWENNWNSVLAPAGVQTMNGKQALLYSRSRETSSDFARTERQRQIIIALKDKVLSVGTLSNPTKISGLMGAFGDNVYSDLSVSGVERLYNIMKQIDDSKIQSIGLTDPTSNLVTTDHVGNISVVRPRAGFNNYDAIRTYVRGQLRDGYIVKENAPIELIGSTTSSVTAMAQDLKTYGYNIVNTGTASTNLNQRPVVVDFSGDTAPYTRHYLEQRFGVKSVTKLPAVIAKQPAGVKFVIITSQNETTVN